VRRKAFTLVELLVVIGIIAVLVGILLPALGRARKQAAAVKCAAALREIGAAFNLYAGENKGFFPVAKYDATYSFDSGTVNPAYWPNFLAKYMTKTKFGLGATSAEEAADARKSIFWACPAFDGYRSTQVGGIALVQNGYGMNAYPAFKPDYPAPGNSPPGSDAALAAGTLTGKFRKQNAWSPASEKALVTDSRFWLAESLNPPANGPYPPSIVSQENINNSNTYTPGRSDQTTVDVYRHGKYPGMGSGTTFDPWGGKIGFNVLYADGHVATSSEGREAYRCIRMKFPG
jgi:prepilin-type N-terminal cleavage/methylation domain-containing protein/prepilin-type processing-associated H-X9-DG protein